MYYISNYAYVNQIIFRKSCNLIVSDSSILLKAPHSKIAGNHHGCWKEISLFLRKSILRVVMVVIVVVFFGQVVVMVVDWESITEKLPKENYKKKRKEIEIAMDSEIDM